MKSDSHPHHIGTPPWTQENLRDSLAEFNELLASAPFSENAGGMGPQHMFATWSIARALSPTTIIESGVWKGAGTWLLSKACPQAEVICLDPCPEHMQIRIPKAQYYTIDFDRMDWSEIDRERTLVFFDDHQDAWERIKTAYAWGFRHLIFEDNYPPGVGDCYSPKKIFAGSGHSSLPRSRTLKQKIRDRLLSSFGASVYPPRTPPNPSHRALLSRIVEVYGEFPPVVAARSTRFGALWESIPCPPPVFEDASQPGLHRFQESAQSYTFLGYVKLRQALSNLS